MNSNGVTEEWEQSAEIIALYRCVHLAMMHGIGWEGVFGGVSALKMLFSELKKQVDSSSIKTSKLLMAELHIILSTKQKNHDLTSEDKEWLSYTEPYFLESQGEVDPNKVEQDIIVSRLSVKDYVSQVVNGELTVDKLYLHRRRIDIWKRREKNAENRP